MANLTATFGMVDNMSAAMENLAQKGADFLDVMTKTEDMASQAFTATETGAVTTARSIDQLNDASDEYANSARKASDAVDETGNAMAELAQDVNKAEQEFEQYSDATEKAGRESEEMGNKATAAIQDLSQVLVQAGITAILIKIGEGFVYAAGKAIEFESGFTGVLKTVNGTTEQLEEMDAEIRALSTDIPTVATDIYAVAESAGQLGVATENVVSFSEVMIDLGETTNLASEEAASALAKFSNITGMQADNYDRLGSTVVALGNNMATTEADIVNMSTNLASAGTLAGLTESDILALSASMSSVGIEAEAGGSAMSKLLTDIQVAVETGSERLDEFASVANMTGEQFTSAFGTNAVDALYQFISGLNDVERNGASATVILENMGLTEVRLSNAVRSLANNHEGLNSAINLANTAWTENTALTAEADLRYGTLESKLQMTKNASDNLAAAFGDDLAPVIEDMSDAGTDALVWLTDFVEENPAVTAGLTATAIAIGIVTVAATAFAVVTSPMVVTAIKAITVAMLANPIFLIITGVVALTAAIAAFVAIMGAQETEYETWTASTKNQYDELENLNAEYDVAVEKFGETSDQANALRYEIDELSASFEANKQTVEEFVAEAEAAIANYNDSVEAHENASTAIENESLQTQSLIYKLEELTNKTSLTQAEQGQLNTIVERLNENIPNLALHYDQLTGSINMTTEAVKAMAEDEAASSMLEENYNRWVEELKQQEILAGQLETATINYNAERERLEADYNEYVAEFGQNGRQTLLSLDDFMKGEDLEEYTRIVDELTESVEENARTLEELEGVQERYNQELEESKNRIVSYDEAMQTSIGAVTAEVDALATSYDEAYAAAYESISSQIGLFQEMSTETSQSVQDMQDALDSQKEFLATYTDNLERASELGLSEGLIDSLSDGSTESAGQLDAIIAKVEELGGTTAEAKEFIAGFNTSFEEVQTAKETFSTQVATMKTDFDTAMDGIQTKLTESIDNMNMEADAATAAKSTIDAYIANIRAGIDGAQSAANAVANATKSALSLSGGTVQGPAYAVGTDSAEEGFALVGENGPELVYFEGGEKVYTADETRDIMSSEKLPTPPKYSIPETNSDISSKSTKEIVLKIEGSGEIKTGGSDKQSVWDIVEPKLKSAFMNMLNTEIFEEGDYSYEF